MRLKMTAALLKPKHFDSVITFCIDRLTTSITITHQNQGHLFWWSSILFFHDTIIQSIKQNCYLSILFWNNKTYRNHCAANFLPKWLWMICQKMCLVKLTVFSQNITYLKILVLYILLKATCCGYKRVISVLFNITIWSILQFCNTLHIVELCRILLEI